MPFEEFKEKGGRGRFGFPAVTLLRSGGFNINHASFEALTEPERVVLAFDKDQDRMGVRKATIEEPHSYPLRKVSGDSYWIAADGFLKYYGIRPQVTTRYRAEVEDGYLTIRLKEQPLQREKRKEPVA